MIATVAFFAEGPVLKGMLVSDMWTAAMHKGMREVFTGERTQLKDVKFVGGVWCGAKKGMEEVQLL